MTIAAPGTCPRLLSVAVALFMALPLAQASASAPPDFSGTWVGATDVPDVGSVQVTLVIKKVEQGYTATISDSASIIAKDTEARDIKVDGDAISFWFPLASGETVSTQLAIAGNTLTGGWTHESGQTGSLRFERTK